MEIDTPNRNEADVLTDLWVALARGQQQHDSQLAADPNRAPIRESVHQHMIAGGLLVARAGMATRRSGSDRHTDIAGFVMFTDHSGRYEETAATGLIENLYVIPEYRNEGIGSALLAAAEHALFEEGIETITLDVMTENTAAQRFYERHGYNPHRLTMAKHETDTHSTTR